MPVNVNFYVSLPVFIEYRFFSVLNDRKQTRYTFYFLLQKDSRNLLTFRKGIFNFRVSTFYRSKFLFYSNLGEEGYFFKFEEQHQQQSYPVHQPEGLPNPAFGSQVPFNPYIFQVLHF